MNKISLFTAAAIALAASVASAQTAGPNDGQIAAIVVYNRRWVGFQRTDVVEFWSKTMGEHSGFIAHLLDPDERLLIDQASKLERSFLDKGFRQVSSDDVSESSDGGACLQNACRKRNLRGQDQIDYLATFGFPRSPRGFALHR